MTEPEAIWERTRLHASERTADDALIRELELEGGGPDRLRLRLVDSRTSTAGFVQSNITRVERIVQKAIGRRITIELATPARRDSETEPSASDAAIAENPLIRKAVGLFDATIHSVRRIPGSSPEGEDSDSMESSSE
ncbi:MAG: hypothetical protein VX641_02410 [Planctomycetota bacterium]|nr:hypothetical protein [Planctomycetota bacterium]